MFIHREDVYVTEEEWNQLHPDQEYPKNIAEIIIAKHRKGPTGSVLLGVHRQPGALRLSLIPGFTPQQEGRRLITGGLPVSDPWRPMPKATGK